MRQLLTVIILAALFSTGARASECKFDGNLFDLKKSFNMSKESKTTIPRSIYLNNRKFFDGFQGGCRGAFVSAVIKDRSTGTVFRYYRTNQDGCDGGNTYGIIVPIGSSRAVGFIQDGDLTCK